MGIGIITLPLINGIRKEIEMANKKKVTIYLEQDTVKRLKMEAIKADISLSRLIEELAQAVLQSSKIK